MPRYEYKCSKCDKITEYVLSIEDRNRKLICPFCEGILGKKVSMPSSPKFTGTGFYETDYKGK